VTESGAGASASAAASAVAAGAGVGDGSTLDVLVPDDLGMAALAGHPALRPLRYRLGDAPDERQRAARALVVRHAEVPTALAFMAGLPALEFVQTLSAGYEQWVGRLPAGVRLSNVSGVHGLAVAELALGLLIAHYRDLTGYAEDQRAGRWGRRAPGTLAGKHVAILGAGDIGQRLAAMLAPFGGTTTLVGRTARAGVISMPEFLAGPIGSAEVVVLALPVTDATRGLADAAFLARMRDGALLVNVGRGPLVDTAALIAEASTGRIGALLDVTDPEPLPDHHPLWSTPGVTVVPHVGGYVPDTWERAWQTAIRRLEAFAAGDPPRDLAAG